MESKTKDELLKKYAQKPIRRLVQYDCFVDVEEGDDIVKPDADKQCLFAQITDELRNFDGIRLQFVSGTSTKNVLKALTKFSNWIKKNGIYDGHCFVDAKYEGDKTLEELSTDAEKEVNKAYEELFDNPLFGEYLKRAIEDDSCMLCHKFRINPELGVCFECGQFLDKKFDRMIKERFNIEVFKQVCVTKKA